MSAAPNGDQFFCPKYLSSKLVKVQADFDILRTQIFNLLNEKCPTEIADLTKRIGIKLSEKPSNIFKYLQFFFEVYVSKCIPSENFNYIHEFQKKNMYWVIFYENVEQATMELFKRNKGQTLVYFPNIYSTDRSFRLTFSKAGFVEYFWKPFQQLEHLELALKETLNYPEEVEKIKNVQFFSTLFNELSGLQESYAENVLFNDLNHFCNSKNSIRRNIDKKRTYLKSKIKFFQ
ncbi:hypothetical protein HMI55_006109 [Coelomomyces lativittatus]|nr:hypothetical protein HMI56_007588 [Coelomomyces lativittatus]KAJ1517750.1 hypothetical protein HMI55_006109 [Coelomomyces lativittatus]